MLNQMLSLITSYKKIIPIGTYALRMNFMVYIFHYGLS